MMNKRQYKKYLKDEWTQRMLGSYCVLKISFVLEKAVNRGLQKRLSRKFVSFDFGDEKVNTR